MKKMAASGKVPLPPQQMVMVLFLLSHDPSPEIAQLAAQSFREQPNRIISVLINDTTTAPPLLNFIAQQFVTHQKRLHDILLHPNTPDETFAWLASRVQGTLLDLIAQNQQRQQRHAPIVQHLLKNDELPPAQRSRIIEFALREKIETGLSENELKPFVAEGLIQELQEQEQAAQEAAQKAEEEEELPDFLTMEPEELKRRKEEREAVKDVVDPLADLAADEAPSEEPEEEQKDLTVEQQLALMSVSQKVKAALKGNKQVRTLLLRDPNKLVSGAVMKNPRLTESEVVHISASRSVSDDIIREVTRNREWMKMYAVKVNLANNPKTPIGISVRLIPHLRLKDLRTLSSNKNVPSAVARNAKKIVQSKAR